ncbi:hypothetical protein AI27_06400 [Sphingomonas sp. BHC-A]|uniref:Uncharacterized protein n=1 Tax=Sphingobium indicum (strain DSM 16412 / CCM 7286 / MTCC 6364 / B90A) TaxID=861109 RepID=A0A1L5BMG5_SPHIB|nr:hypothetical protein [Sphingobium indicum]APL94094.1 hypothetical protein SIDU_06010 [Sphingobium indicum B90A]KEZ00307.1 hypothetical protein AI27_06400 [Sphingomonas sp. BHC-A]
MPADSCARLTMMPGPAAVLMPARRAIPLMARAMQARLTPQLLHLAQMVPPGVMARAPLPLMMAQGVAPIRVQRLLAMMTALLLVAQARRMVKAVKPMAPPNMSCRKPTN